MSEVDGMAGVEKVEVSKVIAAEQKTVWDLLADGTTWPEWSLIPKFELAKEGAEGGESVGAVRKFGVGPAASLEEVTLLDAPNTMKYRILKSPLLIKNYEATVALESVGDQTRVTWSSTFEPTIRGTGGFWRRAVGLVYGNFLNGLSKHAPAQ